MIADIDLTAKSGIPNRLVPVAAIYFLVVVYSFVSVVIQVVSLSSICILELDAISGINGSRCPEFVITVTMTNDFLLEIIGGCSSPRM